MKCDVTQRDTEAESAASPVFFFKIFFPLLPVCAIVCFSRTLSGGGAVEMVGVVDCVLPWLICALVCRYYTG
jgi:hypothetical protein